jgi:hypothetical protein
VKVEKDTKDEFCEPGTGTGISPRPDHQILKSSFKHKYISSQCQSYPYMSFLAPPPRSQAYSIRQARRCNLLSWQSVHVHHNPNLYLLHIFFLLRNDPTCYFPCYKNPTWVCSHRSFLSSAAYMRIRPQERSSLES